MEALRLAAKPSKDRLHFRELFAGGRRYDIQPIKGGATILTSSKQPWRYVESRKRTRSVARLYIMIEAVTDDVSRVRLRSRIRGLYFLDVFLIPLFMTSIIVYVPWPAPVITMLIVLLLALSFSYHRNQAAYQAHKMLFFVHKALEDHVVTDIPSLGERAPDIVWKDEDFRTEWARFYEQRRQERS